MAKNGQGQHRQHQVLKEKIAEYDHQYHVLDQPQISDFEYDQLFSELLAFEKAHPELDLSDSPTQRVGASPLDAFQKMPHRIAMLSLSNSYSPEDITNFDERVRKALRSEETVQYFCEPKFDGLAIELIYEKGLLVRALTRGDGLVGEDVTTNIKTIKSIPLRLKTSNPPSLLEVRGEVLIFKKDFAKLNESQQEAGLVTFANPRNAAAGAIRQLDSKIAASRPLRFFAYALGDKEGFDPKSQSELEDQLENWGLPMPQEKNLRQTALGPEECISYYHRIEKLRSELPFDIDGVVIKVNSFRLQEDLGLVARSPRWATAAKYKPSQAETQIEDIQVQIGRTGALTPVAIMKPVKVGGVTITHATLHNQDEIDRKDVRIGDFVMIQRAGDVIPDIMEVLLAKRPKNSVPFVIPKNCPSCGSLAEKAEEEVVSRCVNPLCPSIVKESLKHFVSRRAMNIDKVGDKLIEALVDAGLVHFFADFYLLKKSDLLEKLERQGEKSAENIITSIEKSRKTSLAKLIYAFGIRFVGEQTAKALADHFGTLDRLLEADEVSLLSVPDIGPKVASSVLSWIQNPKIVKEVHRLMDQNIEVEKPQRNQNGKLSGLSFLITGTLSIKRNEAQEIIEANGGKIQSAVSSKLNYLVAGSDPGSKLVKAESLGVAVIDWEQVLGLIEK